MFWLWFLTALAAVGVFSLVLIWPFLVWGSGVWPLTYTVTVVVVVASVAAYHDGKIWAGFRKKYE